MRKFSAVCSALAILILATDLIYASPIILSPTSRGAYTDGGLFGTGGSGTATGNYLTGRYTGVFPATEYRSFFVFDLSTFTDPLSSASFLINTEFHDSPDATETFALFDFSGSIADLTSGSGGLAAFSDLGSGTSYGSAVVTIASPGNYTVTFNAAGIVALNAALGGQFAMGGALTSIAGTDDQFIAGGSLGQTPTTLAVVASTSPVPEPASLTLIGLGLAGMVGLRRRANQR